MFWSAQFVFCGILMLILVEQYMMPILDNFTNFYKAGTLTPTIFVERLLKLAIPNLYVWLLMFYMLFHCWLNILGELLYFGDRCFYTDWWNAINITDYWQKWNQPVHHWLKRHVFYPLINDFKLNKAFAGLSVFALSGVLHEVLVRLRLS